MNSTQQKILEVMNFRFACKSFDPEKIISQEDFATILEVGRLSPSSFGFEPWKFLVIQNQAIKDKLFPLAWGAQNSLKGASHFVIILARKKVDMHYEAPYITHIMSDMQKLSPEIVTAKRAAYENFQKNNFDLLSSERALFDWSCKQTYIALGNMLTAAAELGIDSCPIEGFNRTDVEEMLTKEGILDSEHFGVSVMAGFGYRAGDSAHPKTRQELSAIVEYI